MVQKCEKFKRVSKDNVGHAQAICAECSKIDEISDRPGMPPDQMQKKFVARGWKMDGTRTRDKCPTCIENKREAGKIIQMNKAQPVVSAKPREMTRDHKRAINEALHDKYISDDVGYSGSESDESVAEALNVPVAWIREIRIDMHGDNAGCEDDASAINDAKAALAEAKTIENETWKKLQVMTDRLARIERAIEAIQNKAA